MDGPAVASDAATAHHQSVAQAHASALASSRRYLLGLVLLLAVVFLWVASSALIQSIFVDQNFHRPFMLTYYSTSLFTLYLPLWAIRQWIAKRGWCSGGSERARMRRAAVLLDATAAPDSSSHASIAQAESASTNGAIHASAKPQRSPVLFDTHQLGRGASGEPLAVSPRLIDVEAADVVGSPGGAAGPVESECEGGSSSGGSHWSVMATARLSLLLCPIWFGMNFFFNLSLGLTSIASSTILATTSSLWVLAFTRLLDPREPVRAQQLLGVCATILGAVLISWKDTGMQSAGADAAAAAGTVAEPAAPANPSHHLAGDVLAALSAVCYGLYSVQLRLRIPDESLVDMQLVFGFLGLANMALTWPCFFLLHAAGVEEWEGLPSAEVMAFLTLNGILGTVVSDFLWAKSVLLTSPLVASLGLALTVPLAITLDWAFHDAAFTPLYILGGLCVLAGFALVNLAHSQRLEERAVAEEEAAEIEEEQGQLHRQHEHEHGHERDSSQLQLDLDSPSASSSSRAGSDHSDLASSPDSQRQMIDKQKRSNGDGADLTSRPAVPLQRSDALMTHSLTPATSAEADTTGAALDASTDEFHLELVPIRLESEEAEGGAVDSDRADDGDLHDQAPPAAYF